MLFLFVITTVVYTIQPTEYLYMRLRAKCVSLESFFSTANKKSLTKILQILEAVPLQTPSDDNEDELSDNSGLKESCSKHKTR